MERNHQSCSRGPRSCPGAVCNLYSITKNQAAIRDLFRVTLDNADNLPPMPGVFPDYPAPVVRNAGCGRELIMMRWGMPPPLRTSRALVTNIRNTSSPHWRAWLKPESRCLMPPTASRNMRRSHTRRIAWELGSEWN